MCGLIGIANEDKNVAKSLYAGLLQMEHRGKECAAAVTYSNGKLQRGGDVGRVSQTYIEKSIVALSGTVGIGHTRYGTTGESSVLNLQPVEGSFRGKSFYIAHNGNLVNTKHLMGVTKSHPRASDTQVIADLITLSRRSCIEDAIIDAVHRLKGAFCLLIIFENRIFAITDPYGFHPLQIGEGNDGFVVASESCVLDRVGSTLLFDIKPGKIITINKSELLEYSWSEHQTLQFDIFEYIYFLRPDSVIHGVEAGQARRNMGKILSYQHPIEKADVIISAPDSGNEAALGYWSGMLEQGVFIEFDPWALFRPHTGGGGRTFIEPGQKKRERLLRTKKVNPRPAQLKDKHVVIVDDSLVRGKTQEVFREMLKNAGARRVSSVIASPVYSHIDPYGIDTYRKPKELAAGRYGKTAEDIRDGCGLDYLGYLDLNGVKQAILDARQKGSQLHKKNFYTGPFTGEYPAGLGDLI